MLLGSLLLVGSLLWCNVCLGSSLCRNAALIVRFAARVLRDLLLCPPTYSSTRTPGPIRASTVGSDSTRNLIWRNTPSFTQVSPAAAGVQPQLWGQVDERVSLQQSMVWQYMHVPVLHTAMLLFMLSELYSCKRGSFECAFMNSSCKITQIITIQSMFP